MPSRRRTHLSGTRFCISSQRVLRLPANRLTIQSSWALISPSILEYAQSGYASTISARQQWRQYPAVMHALQCRVEPLSCCVDAWPDQLLHRCGVGQRPPQEKMRTRSTGGLELFITVVSPFESYCLPGRGATSNSVIDREQLRAIWFARAISIASSAASTEAFPHDVLQRFPSIWIDDSSVCLSNQNHSLTNHRQRYDLNHAISDGLLVTTAIRGLHYEY
jgi:hypothetical protein